jgi:hypothetical protein
MGRTYLFECSKCGYRARVAGGASEGGQFTVQTISCADCRELFDAVTKVKSVTPEKNEKEVPAKFSTKKNSQNLPPKLSVLLNRLPQRGRWLKFKPLCPVKISHRVRLWKRPDKCPRCGAFLEHDGIPFRVWD